MTTQGLFDNSFPSLFYHPTSHSSKHASGRCLLSSSSSAAPPSSSSSAAAAVAACCCCRWCCCRGLLSYSTAAYACAAAVSGVCSISKWYGSPHPLPSEQSATIVYVGLRLRGHRRRSASSLADPTAPPGPPPSRWRLSLFATYARVASRSTSYGGEIHIFLIRSLLLPYSPVPSVFCAFWGTDTSRGWVVCLLLV